ncbi:hypothetical protein VNO77_31206 [Canavalia gladiata]|uniref:Uncharacterized protein n=1 Tax=Canavalia gladiata TaxID=3824 RepID=A0AAN9KQU6_CANGL
MTHGRKRSWTFMKLRDVCMHAPSLQFTLKSTTKSGELNLDRGQLACITPWRHTTQMDARRLSIPVMRYQAWLMVSFGILNHVLLETLAVVCSLIRIEAICRQRNGSTSRASSICLETLLRM